MIPDYFVCTIFHPLIGAQTAGSALSYADKLFQRHVFKVQTGEEDADSQPNNIADSSTDLLADMGSPAVRPAPPARKVDDPLREPLDPVALANLVNMVVDFCKSCATVAELQKYWDDNVETIDLVKSKDRKGYMEILNAFKTRKTQLS